MAANSTGPRNYRLNTICNNSVIAETLSTCKGFSFHDFGHKYVCPVTLICHILFFHPGLGVGCVQVQLDHALANKLRISRIPSIVGVINGKLHHFGGKWGLYEIRDFIRSMFPSDLITQVRYLVFCTVSSW